MGKPVQKTKPERKAEQALPLDVDSVMGVKGLRDHFKARESDELVIGLVGPLGAGVSLAAEEIKARLEEVYEYKVTILKVSDMIATLARAKAEIAGLTVAKRFDRLQTLGNELREEFGPAYLIQMCVNEIALSRQYEAEGEQLVAKSQRTAHAHHR